MKKETNKMFLLILMSVLLLAMFNACAEQPPEEGTPMEVDGESVSAKDYVIEVLKDYQSSDEFIKRREEVMEVTGGQELSEFQATDVIDLRVRYGTRLNFHWLCIKASGAWYYDEESNGIYDGLLLVADYDTGEIYDRFTVPESWNIEPKSPDDETEEWQMYTFITSGPIAGSEKYDGGPLFFEERQNEAKTIFSEEDIAEINEAIRR